MTDNTEGQLKDFKKPSWDDWYMSMVFLIAQRSPDISTKHGAIFVTKEHEPLTFGYNAYPQDCFDEKMPITRPSKYAVMIHSEENAIATAAKLGIPLVNSILYVTGFPCTRCFRNLVRIGIKEIIYGHVGSKCVPEEDVELSNLMNKSKSNPLAPKIRIREYSGNLDFIPLLRQTEEYAKIKLDD